MKLLWEWTPSTKFELGFAIAIKYHSWGDEIHTSYFLLQLKPGVMKTLICVCSRVKDVFTGENSPWILITMHPSGRESWKGCENIYIDNKNEYKKCCIMHCQFELFPKNPRALTSKCICFISIYIQLIIHTIR